VNAVTDIFDGAVAPHNQSFVEDWIHALPFSVYSDEVEFLPASFYHVLDPEVELTAHYHCLRLSCKLVQEVERDTVDLVVDVQTLDVLTVVFHDNVDQIVDRAVLISDENLTVENLVVAEDTHDHLLIEAFGCGLEGDLHASRFLGLEIDISAWCQNEYGNRLVIRRGAYGGSLFSRIPTASSSASRSALCSAFFVASRTMRIRSLVLAAEMTWRPLPLPSEAPSMIPGRSSSWISAPPYSRTPGMAVSVVKAYEATSDLVLVTLERNVDLPTDGKPTNAIRASPLLLTSKPEPPPPPAPGPGSSSCARSRASFLIAVGTMMQRGAGTYSPF
jgi:hypothetical protein